MRILHTSDWHLGNRLMDESRLGEFGAFLEWLLELMEKERVEALLICGDVFDSTTPGDRARELYCDFLSRADTTGCRHIIVTGGNHDSVQLLQVAAPLLARHHAHVIPSLTAEDAAKCLVPLTDADGGTPVLVAAVPFLRAHEVALKADSEDEEARRTSYVRGIAACYANVAQAAKEWKEAHPATPAVKVVAMGHLSVEGAEATASTRSAVIGTVEAVNSGIFDPVFDYVALGHIHKRRDLAGGRVRYCGSPLPMGFDEARTPGEVLLVDVEADGVSVRPVEVPAFVRFLEATCHSATELEQLLQELFQQADAGSPVWLKLQYAGSDMGLTAIHELLDKRAEECRLHRYSVMRAPVSQRHEQNSADTLPSLGELSPEIVFARRLEEWGKRGAPPMPEARAALLTEMFTQSLAEARAKLAAPARSHEN